MKRILTCFCLALVCASIGRAAFRSSRQSDEILSKYVPAGPVLYLEAKDFSAIMRDWNSSQQKKWWVQSDSYEVFFRSRLFLRLKAAGDQFASAVGLPPNMDVLSQIAGEHSVLALYDIGKLQFLYIAYLPSARSMQTALWQTRAKFEPRHAGGSDFYLRRDPESQREVAFAVSGEYLLLSTREDLMANALQLMAGKQDRTVESDPWWTQASAAAGTRGDLRMVLDLQSLVPNGYFRTYWVQQNITDLSPYSAAASDLFRSPNQYREERVLIRKKESQPATSPAGSSANADLSRFVPEDAGVFVATANPAGDSCFNLLERKILAPHIGPVPASQLAPQLQLTSGEQGADSDLETRIDQAPAGEAKAASESALKTLLNGSPILASLSVQSSHRDASGVFVKFPAAVVLKGSADWNEVAVRSAVADFVKPSFTASQLGLAWQNKSGYQQLDGLWPLAVAVRGPYLIVSDDASLMKSVMGGFEKKSTRPPAELYAGFNHAGERENFIAFTNMIDRPNPAANRDRSDRQPAFFSGNMASLSGTLSDVSAEHIEIRNENGKVRQSVTYDWSK
jgi:hypothetical protein